MCLVPAPTVFWSSRNDFWKTWKYGHLMRHWFVAAFAKNEALFNQIQAKQIILKDSRG